MAVKNDLDCIVCLIIYLSQRMCVIFIDLDSIRPRLSQKLYFSSYSGRSGTWNSVFTKSYDCIIQNIRKYTTYLYIHFPGFLALVHFRSKYNFNGIDDNCILRMEGVFNKNIQRRFCCRVRYEYAFFCDSKHVLLARHIHTHFRHLES